MKRRGAIRVTVEALACALGLRADARVLRVVSQDDCDAASDTVRLVIEGDALPVQFEGAPPMYVDVAELRPRYCEGR